MGTGRHDLGTQSVGLRRPWQAVDYEAMVRQYPPPPEYFDGAWLADPEKIERLQLQRLRERALRAERVPFFARRWEAAGFDPRSLRTVDDLWRAPSYTIEDVRKSIEASSPWGDYQGVAPDQSCNEPVRLHTSGGTTGKSRPTLYTQWDREVQAILTARALYGQGVRPGDVVLNSWLYSTHNAAWAVDDALYHWLNCLVITASAGIVTPSERQIELAIEYRASAIATTGDYLLRLADVARDMGYDPISDLRLTALPTFGDRKALEATFGVEFFDVYGFHEVGWIAVECPAHQGLHIFEDACIIQIVDPHSGDPLPDGELGNICITEIYKTGSPQFRYNIMDLSFLYPREQCACGSWLRRMGPFAGRGDNMVKLRGINVWPEAVGEVAAGVDGATTDYFVRMVDHDGRDQMVATVVSDRDASEFDAIRQSIERRLRERLGVRIGVEVVAPGSLDAWTEVRTQPKPKRFRDER
jgi:phenylacetate-CoA ligase